jgi:hypothetical protein
VKTFEEVYQEFWGGANPVSKDNLRHAIEQAFEAVRVEGRKVERGVYQEYDKGYNHAVMDEGLNQAEFWGKK